MSGKYSSRVRIIGITGGIASGKNFVTEIFASSGAPVFDADQEVHQALESNKIIISEIKKKFPKSFVDGKIDRKILQGIVFAGDSVSNLKILEDILHPMVRKNYEEFLLKAQRDSKKIVVLNIPLLHESEFYKCDNIVAVIASPSIQKKRFLMREKRKNPKDFLRQKSEEKFASILKKQISNKEHKAKADFIINSNKSKAQTVMQAKKILEVIHQLHC